MLEEQVDVEYISLHAYIRNIPSDTEMHVEHQLRADRSTQPAEKNIQNHEKLGRTKEIGGKQECQQYWTCSQWVGELKQGSNPHIRATESEEKHLKLRVKQLICGSLNGMRIRQSLPSHTYRGQGHRSPGRCSGWELDIGIVKQSQGEGCC